MLKIWISAVKHTLILIVLLVMLLVALDHYLQEFVLFKKLLIMVFAIFLFRLYPRLIKFYASTTPPEEEGVRQSSEVIPWKSIERITGSDNNAIVYTKDDRSVKVKLGIERFAFSDYWRHGLNDVNIDSNQQISMSRLLSPEDVRLFIASKARRRSVYTVWSTIVQMLLSTIMFIGSYLVHDSIIGMISFGAVGIFLAKGAIRHFKPQWVIYQSGVSII